MSKKISKYLPYLIIFLCEKNSNYETWNKIKLKIHTTANFIIDLNFLPLQYPKIWAPIYTSHLVIFTYKSYSTKFQYETILKDMRMFLEKTEASNDAASFDF